MAQYDRIQKITGADADVAFQQRLDKLAPQEVRDELDAHNFVQSCRRSWETDARKDRVENVVTEVVETFAVAPIAGALAAWRTKGGFPIGQLTNYVAGTAAKFVSLSMVATLPNFEDLNDSPPEPRRLLRTIARTGKVLLHSQVSMTTRDMIEDDQ